jgi:hypothetical protein
MSENDCLDFVMPFLLVVYANCQGAMEAALTAEERAAPDYCQQQNCRCWHHPDVHVLGFFLNFVGQVVAEPGDKGPVGFWVAFTGTSRPESCSACVLLYYLGH